MAEFTLLHTSDWHLGHQLYRRRRDEEFAAFLDWLNEEIKKNKVDCVIIAGDVFDTSAPGTNSQRLYYDFLVRAAASGTRDIIITAGNHDSPTFLTAPAQLLRSMRIHVIGSITDEPKDEILLLRDSAGAPYAIICAVPYLREKDAAKADPGESIEAREARLAFGIREHYQKIASLAETLREEAGADIPVIATGHLFATGATPGDGVRDLYVGSLGQMPHDIFSDTFDYVALGHIHRPQQIGQSETIRYSGSPLPMSFSEAGQTKGAVLVRFQGREVRIEILETPQFRNLQRINGSRASILRQLAELAQASQTGGEEIWIEVEHDGSDEVGDLRQACQEAIKNTPLDILCMRVNRRPGQAGPASLDHRLDDFSPLEIFRRRLAQMKVGDEQAVKMEEAFMELLALREASHREDQ